MVDKQAFIKYLQSLSHELRTPLSSILGYSEIMLMGDDLSEENQENLRAIQESCRQIDKVLSEMREFREEITKDEAP